METPNKDTSKKQVCSINIVFLADTDDEAIGYKKKISEIFSELPDVQVQFRLITAPDKVEPDANIHKFR